MNNQVYKIHSYWHRWLAFILCLALCLGSSSLQVMAAEEEVVYASYEDRNNMPVEVAEGISDNTEDTENQDDATQQQEESTDPDEEDAELTGDSSEEQPDEADAEDVQENADNASDSISDNTLESISENDLQSVSENDLDTERAALVKEAEEAFAKLAEDKMLMALLYHTDSYGVHGKADINSSVTANIEIGTTLYLRGVKITDEEIWYQVQFWLDGAEQSGYVQSYYLAYSDEDWLAWEEEYVTPLWKKENEFGRSAYGMATFAAVTSSVDDSDIDAFPAAYQSALRQLKASHPNWTFVPMNTGLDFNTAVSSEKGDRSLIQKKDSNASKGWVGSACPSESDWYYATESAIAYYMNPCNFLTETYIFQFEQLTFNASYHTADAVQNFLNNTFMKGTLPDDSSKRTYAQAFYEIGKNRKLSPIHLASRVYQEQGAGKSGLISGTYPGYKGYYNFFNVKASGSSTAAKIVNGLTYAKQQGWNTRYKSLEGGAATIGNNYILKGQDTIYLEKFNVNKNSPYGLYNHQYMQNIQAPASESSSTKKMYRNAGTLNSAFVFKIPVYSNMPGLKLDKESVKLNKGDAIQLNASVNGTAVEASKVTWKSSDTSIATVKSGLVTAVAVGETTVTASYDGHTVSCKILVTNALQSISLQYNGQTVTTDHTIVLRREDTVVADTGGFTAEEIRENVSTATLKVIFNPADTTDDRTITWSTSNAKIATVKADASDPTKAVVTAKATGEVTITAKASKAGNKAAACKVQVIAPIYSLELKNLNAKETDTEDTTTIYAGQSINLTAEYYPKDTTSDTLVTWSSDHPEVATVKNGKVTAVSAGTAKITAQVTGREKIYSATHTIVVKECTVTFLKKDGKTVLKTRTVGYGENISAEDFSEVNAAAEAEASGVLFIGWYTGENGTGSLFDETTAVYKEKLTLYPYYEEQGKGFYVIPVGDQTYTGSSIKPVIQVYDSVEYENGDRELIPLTLNRDYTVSYKNNKNVNVAGSKTVPTITVKGKGNYSGTQYVYFNIVPKELTDTDITAADITVAYSGKTIKSAPQVLRGGKKLKANTDYTVTYPQTGAGAYQKAGTYPIVIKGKGGYTGTITVYETITQSVLMSKVSITKIPNQTYHNELVDKDNGIGIAPPLTVKYKNAYLTESEDGGVTGDYTVTYQNNMAIGTATATITAVEGSGFVGSKSITYKIVGTSLTKAKVAGIVARDYTGDEEDVKQNEYVLTIKKNGEYEELIEGEDYTVTYSNISKAGTAKITFQGINEYYGKITKTYKINAYNISLDEYGNNVCISMAYYLQGEDKSEAREIDSLAEMTTPYVKGGSKPVVILYFNGTELTPGKDYTIKYANNNAVTTYDTAEKKLPKITITGKGNLKGSFSGTWWITDGQMSDDNGKLTMTAPDVVYKNKKGAYKASATIKDVNGSKLAAGKDYEKNLIYKYEEETLLEGVDGEVIVRNVGNTVDTADIVPAGTLLRVTAVGKGAYAGENADGAFISCTFRVVAANISGAKIKVKTKTYLNGKPVTLNPETEDLTVTFKGVTDPLEYGVDYVIDEGTYTNNTKKGKATVTIRGIGNYGGEKKITYTIGAKQLLWWINN